MAQRMSPATQANARTTLQSQLASVKTGDPEMDSLLAGEVARRARFGLPEGVKVAQPKPQKPMNPIAQFIAMFARKKPAGGK